MDVEHYCIFNPNTAICGHVKFLADGRPLHTCNLPVLECAGPKPECKEKLQEDGCKTVCEGCDNLNPDMWPGG